MCTEEFIWYQTPEIWAAVVAWIGVAVGGIFGWLFFRRKQKILNEFQKELMEHETESKKNLQKHQTKLDDKSKEVQYNLDTQLEVLKIRLAPLQEKRLQAIQDVYTELVLFHDAILKYVSIIQQQEWGSNQQIWSEVCNCANKLTSVWSHNKLFFAKEIATDMESLIKGSYYKLSEYNHAQGHIILPLL